MELGNMYDKQEICLRDLRENTKLLEALETTVAVYTQQVERHRELHGDVAAGDLYKYGITGLLPHSVEETWYVECTRDEAEKLLKHPDPMDPHYGQLCDSGTFLIIGQ
ncbi:hypothetical protein DPMN_023517 [Dreissena polymorpha]|uniref:Uncharacterized protein n=1 Tax=Dreissena polymorpha TaxID=45954 RepID=A0A9D4LN36_DREPO|nr:hypothetical protein DPMN_023517 [Dreissena polymorpha]